MTVTNGQLPKMRQHIRTLARQHRIKIKRVAFGNEGAFLEDRTVHISPVTGPSTYLVALHEMAHIAHKPARHPECGRRRVAYKKAVLDAEVAAWTWAISRSCVPVPYWMFQRIASCLHEWKGWTGPDGNP